MLVRKVDNCHNKTLPKESATTSLPLLLKLKDTRAAPLDTPQNDRKGSDWFFLRS
jgi:hypothetical protein